MKGKVNRRLVDEKSQVYFYAPNQVTRVGHYRAIGSVFVLSVATISNEHTRMVIDECIRTAN